MRFYYSHVSNGVSVKEIIDFVITYKLKEIVYRRIVHIFPLRIFSNFKFETHLIQVNTCIKEKDFLKKY